MLFAGIDLDDFAVLRIPVAVREVGAQHQEYVALVERVAGGGIPDEAGLADLEGVVVLEALLRLEGEHHGRGEQLGGAEHFVAGVARSAADEQGHAGGAVQEFGGLDERGVVGPGHGTVQRETCRPVLVQFLVAEVTRNSEDGHSALADGRAYGRFEHARHLVRRGDGGAVHGHVAEEQVVVHFLEVLAADLGEGHLTADRQDRRPALGRVVESVEQVYRARSDGSHADPEGSRELRLCSRGEGRGLFVPTAHPAQLLRGADGVGQRVQGVSDDAEDVPDAQLLESVDDHLGDSACHGNVLRSGAAP